MSFGGIDICYICNRVFVLQEDLTVKVYEWGDETIEYTGHADNCLYGKNKGINNGK